jgi:predicted nucleic-acid-binding Zn-ribbon protein
VRDGVCPKCGSEEVYSSANVASKTNGWGMNVIPIQGALVPSAAVLENFVCVACGYVESYIADESKLKDIARLWPKVQT